MRVEDRKTRVRLGDQCHITELLRSDPVEEAIDAQYFHRVGARQAYHRQIDLQRSAKQVRHYVEALAADLREFDPVAQAQSGPTKLKERRRQSKFSSNHHTRATSVAHGNTNPIYYGARRQKSCTIAAIFESKLLTCRVIMF